MSNHEPIEYTNKEGLHYIRCNVCGDQTEKYRTKQGAEDEWLKHLEYVERVRAHLGTRNPSLKNQRDYYLDRAVNDPDVKQRPVWQQLADELSVRLGSTTPAWEQPKLIDL